MTSEWPNIADVTAALESNDPSMTAKGEGTRVAIPAAVDADAAIEKVVTPDASKPAPTPTTGANTSEKKETTEPDATPAPAPAAPPSDLAAKIKEDPRKFLATLPEDAVESMQAVLYPKLHQKLSKRDEVHRAEVARIQEMNAAQVAALSSKIDERIDDILSRTMDPEAFDELKRQRTEKAEAEAKKNAPTPEEAARQAEVSAYVAQAWDVIVDAGFPLPEDRTDFSDMSDEVRVIWQAGWNAKTPLEGVRAMRAKARELKSGKATVPPTAATPPRDPATGKFVPQGGNIEQIIAERVEKALEERLLTASTAITGSKTGSPAGNGGKAPSWDENRRDLAQALRGVGSR